MLRGISLYVLGLVGASALLGVLVPRHRPVLERALAQRSTCQVLVVGPSYIDSGFAEASFDQEAKRIGLGLKACKYAEVGLAGYEVKHVLELLLRERWPKLEYLLIDITVGDRIRFRPENWYQPRVIDWHTWPVMPWVQRKYERLPKSRRPPPYTLLVHAAHVLVNYLGVGRGIAALKGVRLPDAEEERASVPKRRRSRESEHVGYSAMLRSKTAEKARVRRLGQASSSAWARELRELVTSHGHTPLFLVSPVLDTVLPLRGASETGNKLVVFDFQDPARYPEVYVAKARGRTSHLNPHGATIYSRLIAQRLLEYRKSR
jgi:hypothetical protein